MNAIKGKCLLITIFFLTVTNALSMDTIQKEDVFPFDELPVDLKREVVFINLKNEIESLPNDYEGMEQAGNRIKDFVLVNKALGEAINNPRFCLKLIKNFANNFDSFDEDAAIMLGISGANECLALQRRLNDLVTGRAGVFTLEKFQKLCDEGVDLNWTDSEGNTPLMKAVLEDQLDAIKALIHKKVDINYANEIGLTAFLMTINKEIEDDKIGLVKRIIHMLLQAGADPKPSSIFNELLNSCNQPIIVRIIELEVAKKNM